MKLHRFKRGDTIVEVLLAIAIVSAVLAGAYVTTNRSLLIGRDAQEASEALELAEGQIERIKSLSAQPVVGRDIYSASLVGFCITPTLTIVPITDLNAIDSYDPSCRSSFYSVGVEKITDRRYVARVQWPGITNKGIRKVELVYRVQE